MKKILLSLMALPIVAPILASCSALHVHTFTAPYEHDETSHWKTCSICHEKFDQHTHVFNEINDKCFICDYTDPLVYVDENNQMTGLTPYGKTKYTITLPNNVKSIAPHDAFKDSNVVTIKLNKELDYYYETSFSDSHVKTITTEEEMVEWEHESTGEIKKIRVLNQNVAKIGNTYYPTLREAFEAVEVDDTTVTILRDKLDLLADPPIEVKHTVTLSSLYDNTLLSCDFDITNNGILYIPETISYTGNTRLLLTTVKELRGDGYAFYDFDNVEESVYSSGSIVFINKNECPIGANVAYVKSFRDIGMSSSYPAIGAKQVANQLLLIPHNHYAFGTVRFSDDFKIIKGLTKYGQTVTDLTLTSPVKGIKSVIGKNAFSIGWKFLLTIPGVIDDIKVYMFKTKGFFTDLTIGEGITEIKDYAFNNRIDPEKMLPEIIELIPFVFSHLFSVKFGDELETVGKCAFYDNVSLTNVVGGANLKSVGSQAFAKGRSLTSVDFSHSYDLEEVKTNAFYGCHSLSYLSLPPGIWKTSDDDLAFGAYFPFDLTAEKIAIEFINNNSDNLWHKVEGQYSPIYYTKTTRKDSLGRFNDVDYYSSHNISIALSKCPDGGEIYVSKDYSLKSRTINLPEDKSLTIRVAPEIKDFVVKRSDSNDITIPQGKYLMLDNVKPKGKITLKANDNTTTGGTKNTAGFAIRGVDSSYKPNVCLDSNNVKIDKLLSSKANINNEEYDAYGTLNFAIKQDDQGDNYTLINDTSPFGDKATSITFARQTDDVPRVKMGIDDQTITLDNKITNINVSSDVESIARLFLKNFDNLEKVTIDEGGLKTIGNRAFEGCDSLKSVVLPDSVTSIGDAAFNSCDELSSVNIPTSLTSINYQCFRDCPKLSSIVIPNGLKTIGKEAFAGCEGLTSIKFPVNLETIGEKAFENCNTLKSVYIPNNSHLSEIGASAFSNCSSLLMVDFANNTSNWEVNTSPETPISENDLKDSLKAAVLLKTTYVTNKWTRSQPNL